VQRATAQVGGVGRRRGLRSLCASLLCFRPSPVRVSCPSVFTTFVVDPEAEPLQQGVQQPGETYWAAVTALAALPTTRSRSGLWSFARIRR
jgi:hypothetical protein